MAHLARTAIDDWAMALGLMPVPLLSPANAWVLLNGTRGNFCLALGTPDEAVPDRRSDAWSANVGHFVTVIGGSVVVERWDQPRGFRQMLEKREVADDLTSFHSTLEHLYPAPELSVIAHSLRVFRRLRTALGSRTEGQQALSGLLCLLAAAADEVRVEEVDVARWDLHPEVLDLVRTVDTSTWNALLRELEEGLPLHELRPNFRIMLRHASGPLFQEAHYWASFPPPELPGLGISPAPALVSAHGPQTGLYFTPPALARTLVEEALRTRDTGTRRVRLLDPACGSGEFLREAIRQLRLGGFDGEIEATGWDISTAACDMARFSLAYEVAHDTATRYQIETKDALDHSWPTADFVLMNPPFVSVRALAARQREQITAELGPLARGRLDLSSAFIWKATRALAPGGTLATVLPASFFEGTSFAAIREAVAGELTPKVIARLGSQELFQDARVDSGLYIGQRLVSQEPATAVWADHRLSSCSAALRALRRSRALSHRDYPIIGDGFSIYPNAMIGVNENGWAPRPYRAWRVRGDAAHLPAVTDVFTVRQGTLTGLNKAFLIRQPYWDSLPASERAHFRPAILNQSIEGGRLNSRTFVFYPYAEQKIRSEEELRSAVPTYFADYLRRYEAELKQRTLPESSHWWELTRPRNWQVAPTRKLVSTYFGERGSFAWDATGEFVVVQGYAWGLTSRATQTVWLAYLAILNSTVFEDLLSATSDNVGGGQWNLSIRYMRNLPIPDLATHRDSIEITRELAEIGRKIHAGGLAALTPDDDRRLTALTDAAFGISSPIDGESRPVIPSE